MDRLTKVALSSPRLTIALVLLATVSAALGLTRSTVEVGYRTFLGEHHPAIESLDDLIEKFGGGLPVRIVWSCEQSPCESVFDEASLTMARSVERELEALPIVRRVESAASAPLPIAVGGGVAFRRFFEDGALVADRSSLAARALADPLWVGNLVSDDGRVGAIVVQLAFTDSATTAAIVPAIFAALAPHERRGFEFHLVGDPVDFVVAGGELQEEMPRIVPVMVLLIALVMFALLRSVPAVLLALITAGIALLWALGSMAWLSWPQMELTQALPPLILVIGLCDAVHLLARYSELVGDRHDSSRAEREACVLATTGDLGPACLITSLTTAAGFLSFATSGLDSFLRFGVVAALGVGSALVLTFSAFPVVLVRIEPRWLRIERARAQWDGALERIVSVSERRGAAIVAGAALLLVLGSIGAGHLRVDVDEQEMLGSNSRVVQWADFVEDHLRKVDSLEIELVAPPGASITEPDVIGQVARVEEYLPTVKGLGEAVSLLDFLNPVNQILHDGDPAYHRPAQTRAGNEEILLALQMDSQSRIDDWVSLDERSVRLSIEADPLSRTERIAVLEQVSEWLHGALPEGWTFTLTGPLQVYAAFVDEIQRTQLRSFVTAAVAVTFTLLVFLWSTGSTLRSAAAWALAGMFPTALPVVATLGAMGILGIPLDPGTAMVAAIVLGIAIDDTVHLITAYRSSRARGEEPDAAIRSAVRRVGQAVVTTSLALAIGFFALLVSPWQSIASFGLLSGVAILAALLADLFVLPSLIMGFSGTRMLPPEPPEISGTPRSSQRGMLSLMLPVVVLGVLLFTLPRSPGDSAAPRLACTILENGTVLVADLLRGSCPLKLRDRVRSVDFGNQIARPGEIAARGDVRAHVAASPRAWVLRDGSRIAVELPVEEALDSRIGRIAFATILCSVLVGLALFLLWSSAAPAAIPFAGLSACLAVTVIYLVCAGPTTRSAIPYLVATSMLPITIVHLILLFPHQRAIVGRAPGLVYILYGIGSGLAAISCWSFFERPGLWAGVSSLILWLGVGAWGTLALTLLSTGREAAPGWARMRASAALWGTITVCAGIGAAWALGGVGWNWLVPAGLVALPTPIAAALARYQFFDVRPYVKRLVAQTGSALVYAAVIAVLWGMSESHVAWNVLPHDGGRLFAVFLVLLVAELMRAQLRRALSGWIPSRRQRLDRLEQKAAGELHVHGSDGAAVDALAELLDEGLGSTGTAVLLRARLGWRLAAARGALGVSMDEIEGPADQVARMSSALHLGPEGGGRGCVSDWLRRQGIAIAAPVRWRKECYAIVLIGASLDRLPYSDDQVRFADRICREAGSALYDVRQIERLVRLERYSTIGRVATGLMHDIGKPVTIIRQRAKRAMREVDYPDEVRTMARSMSQLAADALATIDRLMNHAREGISGQQESTAVRDAVERAIEAATRIHPDRKICVRLAPDLPPMRGAEDLRLAVVNLLDNALLASDVEETTDVCVSRNGKSVKVEVVDRGCGMTAAVLQHAFEPFYTTRPDLGGRGVGLCATRTLVERLGGSLTLDSSSGEGTRATIEVPLESGADEASGD